MCGATRSVGHGRDRELGTPLASSPAPAWDAVTFLMSWRCRGMKQEGEEVRGPIEVAQAERKCVRGVQRPGETQKTGEEEGDSQGPKRTCLGLFLPCPQGPTHSWLLVNSCIQLALSKCAIAK